MLNVIGLTDIYIKINYLIIFLVRDLEYELSEIPVARKRYDWHHRQVQSNVKWQQHRAKIFSNVVINSAPPVDESCFMCEQPAILRQVAVVCVL
jgi:hypothetical protein